jgi:ankyrin repeat protein
MCSLNVIILLQASPKQTKTQQEDDDRAMENNHEKNRYGAQESKERDGSETGRDRPVPLENKMSSPQERSFASGNAITGQQLCEAARDGDAAKVSTLMSTQGAQSFINYQDADGVAPLYATAYLGHAAVTEQLLKARCNVNLQSKAMALLRCDLLSAGGTPESPRRYGTQSAKVLTRGRRILYCRLAPRRPKSCRKMLTGR